MRHLSLRRPRDLCFAALLAALSLTAGSAHAVTVQVYDGSLGNLPQNQGWVSYQPALFATPPSVAPGGMTLDTAGTSGGAAGFTSHFPVPPLGTGLVNPDWPALDPQAGFTLGFELQIFDEDHLSTDRAGFSLILLDEDHLGIELGFWEDRIWAQGGPDFTQAEGASFDTRSASVLYELTVRGMQYWLSADGSDLLSGVTRDYSPATPTPDPYGIGSYLFLGDNTGSASARFFLGDVNLTVPEPPTWALLPMLLVLARRGRAGAALGSTAIEDTARGKPAAKALELGLQRAGGR